MEGDSWRCSPCVGLFPSPSALLLGEAEMRKFPLLSHGRWVKYTHISVPLMDSDGLFSSRIPGGSNESANIYLSSPVTAKRSAAAQALPTSELPDLQLLSDHFC